MQKVKSIFSPRKLAIWLFVLLLIVTIPEFSKPAMSQTEAIVTLMCVDVVDDQFSLGASVLAPGEGKKPTYNFYYAVGETLGDAMDNVSLSIGKEMGFSQCEIMAFGDTLCGKGIISALDYMVRLKKVSRNAMLINFGGDIKDFSEAMKNLYTEKQLKIEQVINFDKQYILSKDSTIDNFYRGYFSDIGIGMLPKMTVKTEETDNAIQVQAQNDSSGAQSGQSAQTGQEKKLYLSNDGTIGVFKFGKKQMEINYDTNKNINLFDNKDYKGILIINNVNDKLYNNATVVMNITKTKPKIKVDFVDGKPNYKLDLTLTMYIEEIVQDQQKSSFMRRNKEFYTDALLSKIKNQVNQELNNAVELCKTSNLDLLQVYQNFNCFKNKQFKEYLNKVGKDNYLQNIDFEMNVTIESAY